MIIGGIVYDVQLYLASVWTSLGTDPQAIDITRGRDDDLAVTQAGKCTVRLYDKTGKYSAVNAASPLSPHLRPRLLGRVIATYLTVAYPRFYGFLERCETNPDYGTKLGTMEFADLFTRLGVVQPVIAATGPTTTGAAIGKILDWLGWTDPTLRDLDAGDTIPDFSADGTATGLALIQALLDAERGQVYVNGAGVLVYENRQARSQGARTTSQATIATMAAVAPGTDIATVKNTATVTATGGLPQTYTDSASATEFDPLPFGAITSPYLTSDAQALSLGTYMVSRRKDPLPTARRLGLDSTVAGVIIPMLARDIGDRVTVTSAITGLTGDYHIEKIHEVVDTAALSATNDWTLSQRRTVTPLLIGRPAIGDATVGLTY